MPEASYDSIKDLLATTREDDKVLRCIFQCPSSGATFAASAPLVKGRGLAELKKGKQSLSGMLRQSLGSLLRAALSAEAPVEEEKEAVADAADSPEAVKSHFTPDEQKAAALVAFRSLASCFVWDPAAQHWRAAEGASNLLSPFAQQLGLAPVMEHDDREVLSRMLVELARADGKVTEAEWTFLDSFVPTRLGSVDSFMELPELLEEELDQTTGGAARDTMLMLAWALALADRELDQDEEERLGRYAKGLRIPAARALELKGFARAHLLDEAFAAAYPAGKTKPRSRQRRDALALGSRLGLEIEEVKAAEQLFKQRNGLR